MIASDCPSPNAQKKLIAQTREQAARGERQTQLTMRGWGVTEDLNKAA
jgi:hypothetical protein